MTSSVTPERGSTPDEQEIVTKRIQRTAESHGKVTAVSILLRRLVIVGPHACADLFFLGGIAIPMGVIHPEIGRTISHLRRFLWTR